MRPKRRIHSHAKAVVYPSALVQDGAHVGNDVVIGSFCFVAKGARIGDGTRIQSHTSVWDGVTLEKNVFVGPGAMFTNVKHPRAEFQRAPFWDKTLVEEGATIGAKAVLVAPIRIGRYAMIGAGSVVTKDVADHAVVAGNPARLIGWACECGEMVSRAMRRPRETVCTDCRASADLMSD